MAVAANRCINLRADVGDCWDGRIRKKRKKKLIAPSNSASSSRDRDERVRKLDGCQLRIRIAFAGRVWSDTGNFIYQRIKLEHTMDGRSVEEREEEREWGIRNRSRKPYISSTANLT